MTAYYNENDEYAAQWLRNLIAAGHIAPGDVDGRSIEDVCPDDLRGYTQAHFFAGIGVWSYSLRRAGWPDDRPVWTGSCPCQPFSAAGKGAGFTDERHLWPAWFHLIGERRPPVIFGEQVAGKNGLAWLDLVQADLEGLDYACGAVPAPAAGFGAPHIRERLYWMAYANGEDQGGRRIQRPRESESEGRGSERERSERLRATGRMANAERAETSGQRQYSGQSLRDQETARLTGNSIVDRLEHAGAGSGLLRQDETGRMGDGESERRERRTHDGDEGRRQCASGQTSAVSRLDDSDGRNAGAEWEQRGGEQRLVASDGSVVERLERPGPVNGFWRDADWLLCTDGKWRPVEPGTFPLVDECPARVDKLRAYGNAICAEEATAFIEVVMQVAP